MTEHADVQENFASVTLYQTSRRNTRQCHIHIHTRRRENPKCHLVSLSGRFRKGDIEEWTG